MKQLPTDPYRSALRYFWNVILIITLLVGVGPGVWSQGVASAAGPGPNAGISEATAAAIDRLNAVARVPLFQTTRIYDRNGELLYELIDRGRRTVVPLTAVPDAIINATIATEDKNFYLHGGVDWVAVARSAWMNWQANDIVSGASTITQQLARSLAMDENARYEVTLDRKMREAMAAMDMEVAYSKDEILEMYLNTVYYGHRAYGIVAAARTYFDKELMELTLAESALLAGLPQSPLYLDPLVYPEAAKERQAVVLGLMLDEGYITPAQHRAALAEPLRLVTPEYPQVQAPHFVDYVRALLRERYGTEGMRTGLHVYTSLDLRYQQKAADIARAQIAAIGSVHNASNAAVVILHPPTGEILAMVGSVDYYDESIDGQVNMTLAARQPGSSIKPVVYATALDNGWTPASVIWDTPTAYRDGGGGIYRPRNITGRYYGPTRIRIALSNSLNVSAIKLLNQVGIERVIDTAWAMGVRAWNRPPGEYGLSLAVGGYEVPLIELTHAFATLANNGSFVPEHAIREIRDEAGRILYELPHDQPPQYAVSPAAAYQISSILSDDRARQMVFGRNSALNVSQPAAAKTGTTDDNRDNLTVGYTPYVAVGVWVGNSDGFTMRRRALGSSTAAPIWHDIMEAIWSSPELNDAVGYAGQELPQGFSPPSGVVQTQVCDIRPGIFNRSCPLAYEEVMREGYQAGRVRVTAAATGADEPAGFCLPLLPGNGSQELKAQAAFIPLPSSTSDRNAARNWAQAKGLVPGDPHTCLGAERTTRVASQPDRVKPKRLIKIPDPAPAIESGHLLVPGARAGVIRGAGSVPMRVTPGNGNRIGQISPDDKLSIRQGPRKVGNTYWFEVRNINQGLIGWVAGEYLYPITPEVDEKAAQAGRLQVGGRATLESRIDALYVRSKPGAKSAIVGFIKPKHILIIQGGPVRASGAPWYEIFVEGKEIQGWVDGRFLTPRYY